jgi:hypothetical protein
MALAPRVLIASVDLAAADAAVPFDVRLAPGEPSAWRRVGTRLIVRHPSPATRRNLSAQCLHT